MGIRSDNISTTLCFLSGSGAISLVGILSKGQAVVEGEARRKR